MTPGVLTFSGSDSSGGAGLQADVKAVSACGGHAMTVVTAITAQNTRGVAEIQAVPLDLVERQFRAVSADMAIHAVKTGMLPTPGHVELLARLIQPCQVPLVVDPVLAAEAGGNLAGPGVVEALKENLLPLARLVTPNLAEAAALTGRPVSNPEEMEEAARALAGLGAQAVVVTGGHLPGEPWDLLFVRGDCLGFAGPRLETGYTHGTGCTLAAACAALLGRGEKVADAVSLARQLVRRGIINGSDLGSGPGPVNVLHGMENLLKEET